MKRSPRSFALLAVAFIFSTVSLYPQGLMPKRIWNLTIAVNVPGAAIYVDNVPVQGNTAVVTGGPHNVRVQAPGYFDFVGPVMVSGHMTYSVQLQPRGFPLTIRVNQPGAVIYVDGTDVTGTVPVVAGGAHNIQVTAPGCADYSQVINVAGPLVLDVPLQRIGIPLTVNANVPDALVTVNNVTKGGVPYTEYLPRGRYLLRVSANGFADYQATIVLDKPITMNVHLRPQFLPPVMSVVIPPAFLDPEVHPGDPQGQVRVYVDNRLVNQQNQMERIVVAPGRHAVRVASGAFSVQMGDFDFQPGTSYVIELSMDLKVRGARSGPQ